MAGKVYTIQLNLGGDLNTRLAQAIRQMQILNAEASKLKRNGFGGKNPSIPKEPKNPYKYITPTWMRRLDAFGKTPFGKLFDGKSLREGANKVGNAIRILNNDFMRYAFTLNGIRKNFGNFMNVLKEGGSAIMNSNKLIGSLGRGGLAFGATKLIPALAGGGIYALGSKLLNSQNLSEGISNVIQHDMAKKGLGVEYAQSLKDATRIAAEYGYSRTGIINTINTLTGLRNEQGGVIDRKMATDLSRIIGKLGQVGGMGYERVAINMQQILAAGNKPNLRDIRELVHQAPILGKIAQQDMQAQGETMDVREWLKNQKNLFAALNRLDEIVGTHPVAKIKGQAALAKENFWMTTANAGEPFFKSIGGAIERMYGMLERKVRVISNNYDSTTIDKLLDSFLSTVESLTNGLVTLTKVIGFTTNVLEGFGFGITGAAIGSKFGIQGAIIGALVGTIADAIQTGIREHGASRVEEERGAITDAARQYAIKSVFGENADYLKEFTNSKGEKFMTAVDRLTGYELRVPMAEWEAVYNHLVQLPMDKWKNIMPSYSSSTFTMQGSAGAFPITQKTAIKPEYVLQDPFGIIGKDIEIIRSKYDESNAQATKDGESIEDITKGSRSLYINFNKEIVQMNDWQITATDVEDLGFRIKPFIEDAVARGLTIVIGDASQMG